MPATIKDSGDLAFRAIEALRNRTIAQDQVRRRIKEYLRALMAEYPPSLLPLKCEAEIMYLLYVWSLLKDGEPGVNPALLATGQELYARCRNL